VGDDVSEGVGRDAGVDLQWSLAAIAEGVGGRLIGDGDVVIRRVSTDSRDELAGQLFVALVGEHFDGHAFAEDASMRGAAAVLVVEGSEVLATPRIEVADTSDALLRLAEIRRGELEVPIIAITGSTGKTSTKDLTAGAITGAWASPRSFNNEVGVPLTILGTPRDASALVIEVGSRGPGHIRWLWPAVRPDVAVITNLGVVHLETFGSPEGLADAKYELFESLGADAIAVMPADEPRLARGGPFRTIAFGEPPADVAYRDVELDEDGYPSFVLSIAGEEHVVRLAIAGAHHAANAAAALGAATAIGVDVSSAILGMEGVTGSAWRMEIHRGVFTVVNDAYNANPQSVASALSTVAAMAGNKRIAVLGPMAELGTVCEVSHRAMGERALGLGFDRLIIVGPDHGYALGAGPIAMNATGLQEAADTLHAIVEPGDIVLVKASRAAGLERLAQALIEESAP
jgi:UDP-N-acetylmuramoyl-tripeptide--D-alanyl-D-alanine ligase